jgi:hypothetical protein
MTVPTAEQLFGPCGDLMCVTDMTGLVSWWKGDVTGTTAMDFVGLNDGTLIGGATTAAGQVGQAFSFDGVDDGVTVADDTSLNPGLSPFSYAFWFNTSAAPGKAMPLVSKVATCGAGSRFESVILLDGKLRAFITDGPTINSLTTPGTVNDGAWHHFAYTRDSGAHQGYLDGALVIGGGAPALNFSNTGDLSLGDSLCVTASPTTHTRYIGLLDEVQYFNRTLLSAEVLAIYDAGAAGASVCGDDSDGDDLSNAEDNCPDVANAHPVTGQEDSDNDTIGDKCDSDTINPSFEEGASFHASTPFYRARVSDSGSDAGCVKFGAGNGFGGTIDPSIGVAGAPTVNVIELCPTALNIGTALTLNPTPTITQSLWQALTSINAFSGVSAARTHYGSGADGVALGHEVMTLSAATGAVVATWNLNLPAGLTITGSGIGKLTISDGTGPLYRISSLECGTNGRPTGIEGDCPGGLPDQTGQDPFLVDGDLTDDDFFGFQRMIDELNNTISSPTSLTTSCLPSGLTSETIGISHRDGVTSATIKLRQEAHENQADEELGSWATSGVGCTNGLGGTCTLTGTCSATFVTKNAVSPAGTGVSTRLGIGMGISALTDHNGATTAPSPDPAASASITGKHAVGFGEEYGNGDATPATWNGVTFTMNNSGVNRFDGGAFTDYTLLSNDGKTCEFSDCAQVHTGLGFGGSTVDLVGSVTVDFPFATQGGGGVAMGPGARVASGDPCLSDPINTTTNTGRCAVNFHKRGKLTFDTLTINGGMAGLSCGGSDCEGDIFNAMLGDDPNATDQNITRGRGGIGCGGARGVYIGWNVLTNEFLANVPLDQTDCGGPGGPFVGDGSCYPDPLSDPGSTGICNLSVNQVELMAQPNLTKPTGSGFNCGQQYGKCNLGGAFVNPSGPNVGLCNFSASNSASHISGGFELGLGVSGGPNVDPATGRGLRHDHTTPAVSTHPLTTPLPIPQLKACIENVNVIDSETAVSIGGNSDVTITLATLDECQYNCVTVGKDTANIATVTNTTGDPEGPCPANYPAASSHDVADHCQDRGHDYGTPQTGIGEEDHLAAIAAGITVKTKLAFTNSELACSPANVSNSGQEPVLPDIASPGPPISCGSPNSGLTFLSSPACGLNTPVALVTGADMILHPELLDVNVNQSNVCVASPAIFQDNIDGMNAAVNFSVAGTCALMTGGTCDTGPFFTAAVSTTSVAAQNAQAAGEDSDVPVVCIQGVDSDGDGLSDEGEGNPICTGFPGDPNGTCTEKYDFMRHLLDQGFTNGCVNNGSKMAGKTLLCKSQSASTAPSGTCTGTANPDKCLDFIHAMEKAVKFTNTPACQSIKNLFMSKAEDVEANCCM